MTELSNFIKSQINISDEDLQTILSNFQEWTVDKDRFLVKKGQIVTSYYFIKSGGIRIYLDKDDRQITGWLAFQNDFFTELNSLKSGQPTQFNIQAIERTDLLKIDKSQMELLYKQFPLWQQFGRQIWENAFLNPPAARPGPPLFAAASTQTFFPSAPPVAGQKQLPAY